MIDICAIIEQETGQEVTAETALDSLHADSLEFVNLILVLSNASGKDMPIERAAGLATVGDLIREFA